MQYALRRGATPAFAVDAPLLVVHIYKTAGSSLRLRLERTLDARSIQGVYEVVDWRGRLKRYLPEREVRLGKRLYYGHMYHGLHRSLGVAPNYATFLREPAVRAVSHHRHMVRSGTLGTFSEYVARGDIQLDNLQTRMISGHRELAYGAVTERHLEIAITNLRACRVVGIVEQLPQSMTWLSSVLGVDLAPAEAINVGEAVGGSPATPEDLAEAKELNWADRVLYEEGVALLKAQTA